MALDAMGLNTSASDCIWVYTIGKKLDHETRRQWELHSAGDDLQTMIDMKLFLDERARALKLQTAQNLRIKKVRQAQMFKSIKLASLLVPLKPVPIVRKLTECTDVASSKQWKSLPDANLRNQNNFVSTAYDLVIRQSSASPNPGASSAKRDTTRFFTLM